jgi:hypothetical protein
MEERTASLGVYLPLDMHALWRRRAQQKCRERQKQKLKISEVRAQELQRALEQLRLQNSALEARNELLQRMVACRKLRGSRRHSRSRGQRLRQYPVRCSAPPCR